MKSKFALIFAGIMAAVAIAGCVGGCSTTGGATLTPAQIAARVCPPTQTAMTSLKALNGFTETEQSDLAKLTKGVDLVCGASSSIDVTSITSIANTTLPAIIVIVNSSSLSPEDKNKAITDITVAQIVFDAVMASQAGNAPAPTVAAPIVSPVAK